ncbi:hypothetical protein GGF38_000190 [Coemansia sp. RSA 25]|nr:hypothetical protein GGF38_000190 [Coemansia sp. RSA 25]
MKVANYLSLVATGLSLLVATAMGETTTTTNPANAAGQHVQRRYVKRLATSAISGQRGAILFANGKPTSCEVALISNLLGYVSANCLSYNAANGSVDMTPNYQVMLSDGTTTSLGMFSVHSATPHFKYDPTTFANNVALLKFNSGGTREWKNYIGANRADWTSKFFVSRAVTNSPGSPMGSWLPAQAVAESGDVTAQCAAASTLFASNVNDLLCTSQVASSSSSSSAGGATCALPFSSVYGVRDPDLAVAALYSHSVVVGDSLCKYTQIYNYYTLLSNYLEWGGNVAKSTIYLYVADFKYTNNNNPNYSMVVPSGKPSVTGVVVGGDLSGNSPKPTPSVTSTSSSTTPTSSSSPSSSSTTTTTTSSSSATSSSSSDKTTSEQNSEKKGMNIGIILLIVGIILLIVAILAFLLYRRYKKRKEKNNANFMDMNSDIGVGGQNFNRMSQGSQRTAYNGNNHLNVPINMQDEHKNYGGRY